MQDYSINQFLEPSSTPGIDIEICDVTLRDGEQMPGVVFRPDEKLDIAIRLDEIGIEIIEAGFPVVSATEKSAVKKIAHTGLNAKISVLSRSVKRDVDAALDCDVDMVGIFIAISDLHLTHKIHMSCGEAVSCAMDTVEYAKDHGLIVRFSAEDATRTDFQMLKSLYKTAEEHGADYASIADTVGILNPRTTYYMVSEIAKTVKIPICMHCHDDLGMAQANTLAAAEAGAKQLHTTVNGIGERSGNTSLEELLVALRILYGLDRYDTTKLTSLSRIVQSYSSVIMPNNKAVVGENAFAHESGIHADGALKDSRNYELYDYTEVGRGHIELIETGRLITAGEYSGIKGFKNVAGKYELKFRDDKEAREILELVRYANVHTQKPVTEDEMGFIAQYPHHARMIMSVQP